MLQPALLLMLHMGPAHGYDLMERLKEVGLDGIDPSLIYRALHALEAQELIQSSWDAKESQGPPRRVYEISAYGEEMLSQYADELKASRQQIERLLELYEKRDRNP